MHYIKKNLPNGIRTLFVPMAGNNTVTFMVLTATGSHFETKATNGISHFLEHLCFKGTAKRPTSRIITEELDGIGARYNAFTTEECTGYYAKAHKRHTDKIFDIISDLFLHPILPPEEIEKERGVIIGEIDMYEDEPQSVVWDDLGALMYGDQPAGWPILGPREVIKTLSRDDFLSYRDEKYASHGTLLVVAGDFNEHELEGRIEETFGALPAREAPRKSIVAETQEVPAVYIRKKETSQSHLVLGIRACKNTDPRVPALSVFLGILGAGMSSRLFVKIREELGLGYYVGARSILFSDFGIAGLYAGVANNSLEQAVHAMLGEVRSIKNDGVSEGELRKIKDFLVGNMYLSLERSDDLANFYGITEISGLPLKTPQEKESEIRSVTAEQVQRVVNEICKTSALNLAIIGPHADKDKFLPILSV